MSSIRKLGAMRSDQDEAEKVDRRTGAERRRFSYSAYIPERRTGLDRRKETGPNKSLERLKIQDSDK